MKILLKTALFILIFWSLSKATKKVTDGFALIRLAPLYEITPSIAPPQNLSAILSQPFSYLSKGGQSYVFLSADNQYVLKFFKKQHHLPDSLITRLDQKLPRRIRPCRPLFIEKQEERFGKIFRSCQIAYEKLAEETGLIYIHLTPSKETLPPLFIYDRLGVKHEIDPHKTAFLLQKKAPLLFPSLKETLDAKGEEGIKTLICTILSSFKKQSALGIENTDKGLMRNYGLLDKKLISFDIGSFVLNEKLKSPEAAKKEISLKTKRLKKWLKKNIPSLIPFYEKEIESQESINIY